MIYGTKEILERAKAEGYAVGAFNTVNVETTRAIIEAAIEERSPVVVQMTEKTLDYAGGRAIFNYVKNTAEFYAADIPIAIHLDHGKSFEVVERSIEIGFPSVMYDGSRKEYPDNLSMTKKIVEHAHARGVSVQGELGSVPYLGEVSMEDVAWDEYMTDPEQAEEFVRETGIDTLAVAIGNAHGFFRERSEPDYERLSAVASRVTVPLVLHGASDWHNGRVAEVIKRGISCFNVDTAIRLAFLGELRKMLDSGDETDLRKILGAAKEETKDTVRQKMKMFGSAGKAW
ncbi:MAG: class II fructose-bisphosphate aldolase family protein [Candidatus Moranbacteria bacterium]|nr:class II fructose-bisphosphate aldolase family protein [Candidatus Moranbacteria bacterium]MBP6034258.1 class II fructose-bisphosphate aldolase family protein [Candidatus Moranbacteria bacterium]MBP7695916.1 class II fructose-bisphosphate aldolase family protein [Candidatus Moranbacteria bacterium]